MKSIFGGMVAVVVAVAGLAACGDDVPSVQDPSRIVIHGKMLSQQEFLSTYCTNKKDNDTCMRVSKSMSPATVTVGQVAPTPK